MIKASLEKYQTVENTICNFATIAVVDGAPEYIQEHNIRGDANIQYMPDGTESTSAYLACSAWRRPRFFMMKPAGRWQGAKPGNLEPSGTGGRGGQWRFALASPRRGSPEEAKAFYCSFNRFSSSPVCRPNDVSVAVCMPEDAQDQCEPAEIQNDQHRQLRRYTKIMPDSTFMLPSYSSVRVSQSISPGLPNHRWTKKTTMVTQTQAGFIKHAEFGVLCTQRVP